MPKYSYGITSVTFADIDPATGLPTGTPVEVEPVIYRDTFELNQEDGTTTDHYAEMNPNPAISFTEQGKDTGTLQIMDTDPDLLELFLGGTVTEDAGAGKKTWHSPSSFTNIEKYLKVTTQDGTELVMPRARVTARKLFQIRRNQIWVIEVTVTALQPQVAGLSSLEITSDL